VSRGDDRSTQVIRQHWDRRARSFDDEVGHGLVNDSQRLAWLDILSRIAGRAPIRVLDVGCGTGFVACRFAELGHIVTGIDLSAQMIDQARRKATQAGLQIELQVGDAVGLDLADETYDLVVARHVIWNLPHPDRAVAEWLRVLRPGGRLLLIEGKWADNEAVELSPRHLRSRLLARAKDAIAALVMRTGGHPRRLLNRSYRRLERRLPFAGGPSATRLAHLLEANAVCDIRVEPLMDPALWGEQPQFPRYLATGTRSLQSKHGR
jgi:ubiquinone/menaquinone biosynthesis C-methylase UbiE